MSEPIMPIPKIPQALYSCYICAEDYSLPAEDIYCSDIINEWVCENCWNNDAHGHPAIRLADVLKKDAERENADLRSKLSEVARRSITP